MSKKAPPSRQNHTGKGQSQRSQYARTIMDNDCESTTIERRDPAEPTNSTEAEPVKSSPSRKRSINHFKRFQDYVYDNVPQILLGIILVIAGYFFVDARTDIARLEERLGAEEKSLQEVKTTQGVANTEITGLRLDVERHKILIENLSNNQRSDLVKSPATFNSSSTIVASTTR